MIDGKKLMELLEEQHRFGWAAGFRAAESAFLPALLAAGIDMDRAGVIVRSVREIAARTDGEAVVFPVTEREPEI